MSTCPGGRVGGGASATGQGAAQGRQAAAQFRRGQEAAKGNYLTLLVCMLVY